MSAYELAAEVCEVNDEDDYDAIDEAMFEKFNIGMAEFEEVVQALLPLIDVGKSPLTGKTYKGFSVKDGSYFLLKIEVTPAPKPTCQEG